MGARLIGVWAATALALLVFAGGAAGTESSPGGSVILELRGTHGYSLLVMAGARPGQTQGRIAILAHKPHSQVTYGAPATVTPTGLEADLGAVGRISLQLQPSGVTQSDRDCDKKRVEYEGGTWVGELEIHGEEGFTTVSATRLPFSLKPVFRILCGTSIVGRQSNGDGAVLHLGATGPPPRLDLSARTSGPGKAVEVSATVHELRGEVEIERTIERHFPASSFSYTPNLASATLRPPAPFSGRGVFRRDAAPANRWTGNLRIDFPGRPRVPATGGRLRPVLRHGEWRRRPVPDRPALMAPTLPAWPSTKP